MAKIKRTREVDEVDDYFDTLMRAGRFPDPDNALEATCNAVLDRINQFKAGDGGDAIDAELLEPELRTAIINMVHGGRDPASVPYRHIRHAIDNPLTISVWNVGGKWSVRDVGLDTPLKMLINIDGPLKGIRAKCVACQGGSLDLVRSCPSVNCFLWSFRMNTNPMYGRLKGPDNDEDDGFEGDAEMAASEAEFAAEEAERLARMGTK